jgi:glutathione peroxidase
MKDFKKYIPEGLEMLAYPSQQFGGQEYKSDAEVQSFAANKGFEGTVMAIGDVKGPNASEAWKFFYQETGASEPTWNFKGKFLVSRKGVVSAPSNDLEGDIQRLLNE